MQAPANDIKYRCIRNAPLEEWPLPGIIHTLIDRRERSRPSVLPKELRIAYGGDLWFPPSGPQRPYVIGNFVSTVDGVVSCEIAGKSGGSDISGFDQSDRFIMGLLRASADAVMVGSVRFTRPPRSTFSSPTAFVREPVTCMRATGRRP
jgi:hypothetical protein